MVMLDKSHVPIWKRFQQFWQMSCFQNILVFILVKLFKENDVIPDISIDQERLIAYIRNCSFMKPDISFHIGQKLIATWP